MPERFLIVVGDRASCGANLDSGDINRVTYVRRHGRRAALYSGTREQWEEILARVEGCPAEMGGFGGEGFAGEYEETRAVRRLARRIR